MSSKKPERHLASLVFPKSGPVRLNSEQLGDTNPDLELRVGRKLAAALSLHHGITLGSLQSSEDQADPVDLWCEYENRALGLQLAEATDREGSRIWRLREMHQRSLNADAGLLGAFKGYHVDVVSSEEDRTLSYPRRRSGAFTELAAALLKIAADLSTLLPGKQRARKITLANGCDVHVLIAAGVRNPTFWWGGGRTFLPNENQDFLTIAVRNKIDKRYNTSVRLWLIIYSVHVVVGNEAIQSAHRVLSATTHPFEQAWAFYPAINRETGHAVRIWRRPQSEGMSAT